MIGDALDTAFTLLRALAVWVILLAAAFALAVASLTAAVAWIWNALRNGPRRPSWTRGRLRAARLARAHRRRGCDTTT